MSSEGASADMTGPAPAAVVCRGLGKAYRLYRRPRDRLLELMGLGVHHRDYWAVRGVDLEVRRGESMGVLGRNGAGKSTLLQLICGTLRASEGTVVRSGRISPLLELGSGFNPEFTGRENVNLCATILGLRPEEVRERFDDIVAFADIGEFLDQPVKIYSSGMRARLAFAVAVHVDASVLILDEILSVGDAAFQRKCYARLRTMKEQGVTILFVSHAPNAVVELCDRAVLIDGGERLITGEAKPVAQWYQKLIHASASDAVRVREEIRRADAGGDAGPSEPRVPAAVVAEPAPRALRAGEAYLPGLRPKSTLVYSSNGARIEGARIETESGLPVNVLERGRVYRWCYEVVFERDCVGVRLGMLLKTVNGVELFGTATADELGGIPEVRAGTRMRAVFPFRAELRRGTYFLNCGLMGRVRGEGEPEEGYLARIIDAAMFRVEAPAGGETLTAGWVDLSAGPAEGEIVEIAESGVRGVEGRRA